MTKLKPACPQHPYEELARAIKLEDLPAEGQAHVARSPCSTSASATHRKIEFRLRQWLPMAKKAPAPWNRHAHLGTVGNQTALHLFQTKFCPSDQSADRPDPRRLVMSLVSFIGPRLNLRPWGTSGLKGLRFPNPFSAMAIWRKSAVSATLRTTSTLSRST